jgi:hypothetical protein
VARGIGRFFWWLIWWRPPYLEGVVIVNLISDPDAALRGIAWRSRGPWLVLRQAHLVKARLDPVPIDGEVVVHRSNISFVQVLPS